MSTKGNRMLRNYYKDITFDTLKERHDNFSFEKVIDIKNQVNDTMHFQGIISEPNNPKLVVFKAQGTQFQQTQGHKLFNNTQYVNNSLSSTFYEGFQKQFNQTNKRNEPKTVDNTFGGQRSNNMGGFNIADAMESEKNSSSNTQQNSQTANIKQKHEEENLWKEFSTHFQSTGNKVKDKMRATHHDFLETKNALPNISNANITGNNFRSTFKSKFASTKTGFNRSNRNSSAGFDQSFHGQAYSDLKNSYIMPNDRMQRNRIQYQEMQKNSVSIPLNPRKAPELEEKLIMRAKLRTAQREVEKKIKMALEKRLGQSAPKKEFKTRAQIFEDNFSTRKFDDRYIYFIQDDQNIFGDNLKFTYVEVNTKLCRMVPQKTWDSKQAQRMNLYQKIEFAKPSALLQKQNLLETLDEINQRLKSQNTKMWMLDGTSVKSLLKIPKQCRVLIVGNARECQGLEGLDKFDPSIYERPIQNTETVKPSPATWVQTATSEWITKNKASNIPNYMQQVVSFKGVDQDEFSQNNNLMQSLQAEHKKVHLQDQSLLEKVQYGFGGETSQIQDQSPRSDCKSNASPSLSKKMTTITDYYPAAEIEEQLIKFLIEKVVVMREKPFIQATEQLRQQNDMKKIHNHLKNTLPRHVYTSKVYNKHTFLDHQKKNYDTSDNKRFYEEFGSEDNTVNKVTFKVQKNKNNDSKSGSAQGAMRKSSQTGYNQDSNQASQIAALQQSSKLQQQGRMLRNDEIKEICEKHGLSRQEVYSLRSKFASMCMLSESWTSTADEQDNNANNTQNNNGQANNSNGQQNNDVMGANKAAKAMQPEGIKVGYFVKYCSFLAGCLPHINERILVAHGLDIENQNSVVNWQTFLELYCIFEAGRIEKSHLVKFWIKFFDRKLTGTVPEPEYMKVLEEMVRGSTLDEPTDTTRMFAQIMKKMMKKEGCLGPKDAIIDEKLAEAFTEDRIDIQLLCSALGTKELDSSFIDHSLSNSLTDMKE